MMKKVAKIKRLKVSFLIMFIIITGLTKAQQNNSNLLSSANLLTNSLTSGDSTFPQLDSNLIVGSINGTYTVNDNGAAIYSIPILLPPGTGGMLPSVCIEYNSQSGDGWLGKGWSISGLSSISRMPKTFYLDNKVEGIKFNNTDHFVLDGNVLIPINGNNGENGTEYRTEAETFSQIFSFCSNGSTEPDYFIVHTKDGRIIEYGKSQDSRQKLNGLNKTLAWHMNNISNANTNYIRYIYINDIINGRFKLDYIEYTGNYTASILPYNKIKFSYTDDFPNDNTNNPNNRTSYIYGCKLSQKDIIKEILIYNEGSLVRKYAFSYINEFKTLLKKITLSDANGNELNPTIFNYTDRGNISFSYLPVLSNYTPATGGWNENNPRFTADVNGDGMEDIVGFSEDHVYVSLSNGQEYNSPQIWYYNGFCHGQYSGHWQSIANNPNVDETQPRHLIDVNGDGMADIVGFAADGVYVSLSTGSSFSPMILWIADFGSGVNAGHWINDIKYPRFIVDVNGDKLPDIVGFAEGSVKVALNTGTSFIAAPQWDMNFWGNNVNFWYINTFVANTFHSGQWYIRTMADVNGDGLADIIGFHENDVYVSLSNGINGFSQPIAWIHNFGHNASVGGWNTNTNPRYVIDLNGDGMADIIGFSNQGVEVALSNGLNQFIHQGSWSSEFGSNSTISWSNNSERPRLLSDVNGDGLPDIVGFGDPFAVVSINTGHSFLPYFQAAYIGSGFNFTTHIRGTTDVNGDGRADIITFGHNNVNTVISKLDDDRKIQKIRNGLDFKIQFSYKPLINNTNVYSYSGHESYPFLKFSSSIKVVDVSYAENGIGLSYNSTNYQYSDAIAHLKGKGFLGFRKIMAQSYDASTLYSSFIKKNDINYIFCFNYLTQSVENGNGAAITTDYNYFIDSWPNKRYFQKLCSTVAVDALSMNKITKDYCLKNGYPSYDGYGNPQTIFTNSYDISNGSSLELTQIDEINYTSAGSWCSYKADNIKTTKQIPNETPVVRNNAYIYSNNGNLIVEKTDVGDLNEINTSYNNYDVFGNPWTKKVIAPNSNPLLTTLIYNYEYSDIYGRFLTKKTNSLGQYETFKYDTKFGNLIKKKTIDNINSQFDYDGFGRLTKQINISDGTFTSFSYKWEKATNQNIPATALYKIITTTSCEPNLPLIIFYDKFERDVQQENINLNGNKIYNRKEYNSRGLIDIISLPFFNASNILWTNTTYDNYNRKTHQYNPDGSQININYNGKITTTVFVNNGQSQKQFNEVNSLNQSIKTIDDIGNIVMNSYYSSGLLKETWIDGMSPNQHTTITYDLQGNRLSLYEPNSGTTLTEYNAYGNLINQKDAKSNIISMKYDILGRIINKSLAEGNIEYIYDVEPQTLNLLNEYAGKLSTIIAHWNNGEVSKEFYYDILGRECKTVVKIDGKIFDEKKGYDNCNRIISLKYPDGIIINNIYKNGELFKVKNISINKTIWQADLEDNFGNITQSTIGENGNVTYKYYDYTNGRLTGIYSKNGNNDIQKWEYGYDNFGNISFRKNYINNIQEDFTYDQINRLVNTINTIGNINNIQYDNLGNIISKDNLGNNSYSTTQINALTETDNNSNLINLYQQNISYTSFNKVAHIFEYDGNHNLDFTYAPDFTRCLTVYKNANANIKKYFVFDDYEETENRITGEITRDHYIGATNGLTSIYRSIVNPSSTNNLMYYVFTDNLGSLDRVTEENGNILDNYSFDAWGNRRDYFNWNNPDLSFHLFDRGFTGHEHLDKFGLINMNGRLYDPLPARFLSPDNYMQAPDNSQNFNRYSYCINNPLKYTDPSGELFGIDDAFVLGTIFAFSGISNCIVNQSEIHNFGQGLGYFGIGVASAAAGLGVGNAVAGALNFGGFASGAIVGASGGGAAGFVGGTANSWAYGNSFSDGLKSGLINGAIGAVVGGVFGGIPAGIDAVNSDGNFWTGSANNLTVNNTSTTENEVGGNADKKSVFLNEEISGGAKPTETGKIAETNNNPNYGKYGMTRNGGTKAHNGIDYVGEVGDNVYVMYDGKVIYVGKASGFGSHFVRTSSMINGKNYNVEYGHMSQSVVSKNQQVYSGQLIGKMGREGNLSNTNYPTHVHIQIWRPIQGSSFKGFVMPSWK